MGAGVDLERVGDLVAVQDVVEFRGRIPQRVLIADIHANRAVAAQRANVLVHKDERRIGGPFRQDVRLGRAVLVGQVEIEWRILRIRRPGGGQGQLGPGREGEIDCIRRRVNGVERRLRFRRCRPRRPAHGQAGAHQIEGAEHVRMLHADPRRAVTPHRVAGQTAAPPIRDRAIVGVDVGHEVVGDEGLEITCGD